MADGVVVIAGLFEPGSVVTLTRTAQDVFRAEGGVEVSRRIVDDNGLVGWDQLDVGAQYVASGYVNGWPVEQPVKATDVDQQSNDLNQAPAVDKPALIGTGESAPVETTPNPPAVPEGEPPLEEGVPDGVAVAIVGAVTYFICKVAGVSSEGFSPSGLQAPAEEGADGTKIPARPLYTHDGPVDLATGEWEGYAGPTEPLGTTDSAFAPNPPDVEAENEAKVEAAPTVEAVEAQTTDPIPADAPVETTPAPSEPVPAEVPPTPDPAPAPEPAPADPAPADPAPSPAPAEDAATAAPATDGAAEAVSDPAPAPDAPSPDAPAEPAADGSAAAPVEAAPAPEASTDPAPDAPAPEAPAPETAPADGGAENPA